MDTTTSSPTRSSSSKLFSIVLAVGVGLWATAFTAQLAAADPLDKPTAPVSAPISYGDLDLSTDTGARTLLSRITIAARSACGGVSHSPLLPREGANHRECVSEAVDAAVARIDAPALAAVRATERAIELASR